MTASLGRLIQPYVQVTWGDLNLSSWDYGDKMARPVVFNVTVDLSSGNKTINKASLEFDPSPVEFRAYTQCVSEDYIKKPIKIKFGYEKGSFIETVYFFQNVDFTTGKTQQITTHLAGLHKNLLTSHWWNEYMGDGIKEMSAKDLFDNIIKKAGMQSEYTEGATKLIEGLPKITKAQVVNQTAGSFIVGLAERYGLILEYPTGSEDDNKKVVISVPSANEESLSVEEKQRTSGKLDVGSKRKGKRLGFIIGPTLATEIKRSTKPFGSSDKNADMSYDVSIGADDGVIDEANEVESPRATQGKTRPSGSTSSNEKVQVTECEGKSGSELTKCRKKIREASAKKASSEYSQCSSNVFMVPYMVGIRPYDFVVFPSLKGDYIEDWEVEKVSYSQEGGGILISINGKRPQVGKGNLMDETTLKKFQDKATSLKTLADWHQYYWNIK